MFFRQELLRLKELLSERQDKFRLGFGHTCGYAKVP